MADRAMGVCQHCGKTIEHVDENLWIHSESRKVSCQLYATPLTPGSPATCTP